MDSNTRYFMLRAEEERDAADHASDRKSRETHLELARRYDELGGSLESEPAGEDAT